MTEPAPLPAAPPPRPIGASGKAVGGPAGHAGAAGAPPVLAPGGSVAATPRIVPVTTYPATTCDAVAVRGFAVPAPGAPAAATLPRTGKVCSGTVAPPQLVVGPVAAL